MVIPSHKTHINRPHLKHPNEAPPLNKTYFESFILFLHSLQTHKQPQASRTFT